MNNGAFVPVLIASVLAACVTTAGIVVIYIYEEWGKRNCIHFMSFAAGVLISVSFLHIVPKSLQMSGQAPAFLLFGFFLLFFLNRYIHLFQSQDSKPVDYTVGIIPMWGIGLHSLLDGVIYSVTFNVSIFSGVLAAVGMILHEFPEGIVIFVLLNNSGYNTKKSAIYAFFAAALSTPVGAVLSFPFIEDLKGDALGIMMSISAGALIYVGATHLLPAAEHEQKRYTVLSLAAGILVALLIIFTKTQT